VGTARRVTSASRPAFYALSRGGWRDYVTILHPPYTLWHLSYVVVGAMLAPRTAWAVVGLTVAAFALALGVGAHALDELRGRPLDTAIPRRVLVAIAAGSIAAAAGIGVAVAVARTMWLLVFVAAGTFLVTAYNLELAGGRFHSDTWFGLAWGAFPVLTGYFAVAERLRWDAVLAAAFAFLLSLAQRVLSREVRTVRRDAISVEGTIRYRDGTESRIDPTALTRPLELALRLLTAAAVALAIALVVHRLV
jgi:heme O synthase-like polyprenyltransferase